MRFLIAVLILGLVILFHELGHFLLAKANHIVVLEFALGMGPKILSFQKGETTYAWRALPFGGSCSMLGEEDTDEEVLQRSGSFQQAALWRRALVIAAGPCFNFIMALVGAMILIGVAGADPARVTEVEPDSPAFMAGLQSGDRIVRYEGNGIANASELYTDLILQDIPTDSVHLTIDRAGKRQKLVYKPDTEISYKLGFYYEDDPEESGVLISRLTNNSPLRDAGVTSGDILTALDGETIRDQESLAQYLDAHPMDGTPLTVTISHNGKTRVIEQMIPEQVESASLGFSFNLMREKQSFGGWLTYSFGEVRYWIHVVFQSLASLIRGDVSMQDMSGPVGIVGTIGDAYTEARPYGIGATLLTLLHIVILLSANLGTMNLIPFPALDGGRLLLLLIEAIRRRPVDRQIEARINYAGLLVLMTFMVYITAHDILKIL